MPILILGATGPLDATKRRPWIDWLHTATDQAALVRHFIKFDDQPHSPNAAIESLLHATAAASTKPCAPTYVCLDLSLQEDEVDPKTVHFPETKRYLDTSSPGPSSDDVSRVLSLLQEAKKPLFMLGRADRSQSSWKQRIELAERFDARVVTDLKQASSFPTDHKSYGAAPSIFVTPQMSELIRSADLIVSFDWVDLAGALKSSHEAGVEPAGKVIHISLDSALHNGWSKDSFGLPLADVMIQADVDKTINAILTADSGSQSSKSEWLESISDDAPAMNGIPNGTPSEDIFMTDLAHALYSAILPKDICLVRVPLGWKGVDLRATHPLAFMGMVSILTSETLKMSGHWLTLCRTEVQVLDQVLDSS